MSVNNIRDHSHKIPLLEIISDLSECHGLSVYVGGMEVGMESTGYHLLGETSSNLRMKYLYGL